MKGCGSQLSVSAEAKCWPKGLVAVYGEDLGSDRNQESGWGAEVGNEGEKGG
jgi:hypothetical protein